MEVSRQTRQRPSPIGNYMQIAECKKIVQIGVGPCQTRPTPPTQTLRKNVVGVLKQACL